MIRGKQAQRIRTYRPFVETLEDRNLLSFCTAQNYSAGSLPYAVATGDFNGDNRPDLAVPNAFANTVSVLLNSGTGTFGSPTAYPVGSNPNYVDVGDLRGTGKVDLVVATSDGVSVLLGNGNGTFQPYTLYDVNHHSSFGLAVGDVNGDGIPDVVTANSDSATVSVLLGNGDGTFRYAGDYNTDYANQAVELGDFNGDNKLDVVTANNSANTVTILLGNGDGSFQGPTHYSVGDPTVATGPRSVVVGDFNHDGVLDLAVADDGQAVGSGGRVSVFLGNGNGTFQNAVVYTLPAGGFTPYAIDAGDFNRDGNLDLVTADYNSQSVSVWLGNGDGTFRQDQNYSVGAYPRGVAVDDFNGDQYPDVVTANINSGDVSVLINSQSWYGPVKVGPELSPALFATGGQAGEGRALDSGAVLAAPATSSAPAEVLASSSANLSGETETPLDTVAVERVLALGLRNDPDLPLALSPWGTVDHSLLNLE